MSAEGPFVGPVASPELPEQPKWPATWCPRWEAFDVPRLWDMVEPEGNDAVRDQVLGFRQLAGVLEEFYRLLRTRRDQIAEAWQSPASAEFLRALDEYGADVLSNSACSLQTAYALDSTVEALVQARGQIGELKTQWEDVTTDWVPEWWGHEAAKLNDDARKIMVETDKAIAAARPKITSPDILVAYGYPERPVVIEPEPDRTDSALPGGGSGGRVPPVPGYNPVAPTAGSPELAEVSGAPRPVAAVPGQPVSMLPIPPGSPYAPFGGAYILPGPGVGRGGYVVQVPPRSGPGPGVGVPRTVLPSGTAGGAAGAAGMMPVPLTGGPGAGTSGQGALYRRPNIAWHVGKGVPPVIKVEQDEFVPDQPSLKQEEEFRDWFSDLAYPWRAEFKSSEGAHVTVRTVEQ